MPTESACLDSLLSIICSVFDAYSAVLFLPEAGQVEGAKEEFTIAACFSLGDDVDRGTVITPGKGLVGWIIRNRKPLLINNFDTKRSHLGYYPAKKESRIKAFMGAPLAAGRGALCMDSMRTYSFSDKEQKILGLFASLAADIRNSSCRLADDMTEQRFYQHLQLISGLRRRFPRWDVFLAQFLELMAQATGFDHCFLAARDETGSAYFLEGRNRDIFAQADMHSARFPMGGGLIGWVFNNGSPVYFGESDAKPGGGKPLFGGKEVRAPAMKSFVCLPLVMHKKTRSVLVLAHPDPRPVPPAMRTFVEMAVDNLGLFLENLYLKTRVSDA